MMIRRMTNFLEFPLVGVLFEWLEVMMLWMPCPQESMIAVVVVEEEEKVAVDNLDCLAVVVLLEGH